MDVIRIGFQLAIGFLGALALFAIPTAYIGYRRGWW